MNMKIKHIFILALLIIIVLVAVRFQMESPKKDLDGYFIGILLVEEGDLEPSYSGKLVEDGEGEKIDFSVKNLGYIANIIEFKEENSEVIRTYKAITGGMLADVNLALSRGKDFDEFRLSGKIYGKDSFIFKVYKIYQLDEKNFIARSSDSFATPQTGMKFNIEEDVHFEENGLSNDLLKMNVEISYEHINVSKNFLLIEYDAKMKEIKRQEFSSDYDIKNPYETSEDTAIVLVNTNLNNQDSDDFVENSSTNIRAYTKNDSFFSIYEEDGQYIIPKSVELKWK